MNIQFADEFAGVLAASSTAATAAITSGTERRGVHCRRLWARLPMQDGVKLASAPSQGVGIYAVLQESAEPLPAGDPPSISGNFTVDRDVFEIG